MNLGLRGSAHSTVLRHLEAVGLRVQRSLARVGSGQRIVTAADDAAGLGVSERMRARLASLRMAQRNTAQGLDLVRAADAALGEVGGILGRLSELAVAFNNGLHGAADLATYQAEWDEQVEELSRLMVSTELFGQRLLGSNGSVTLQVGVTAGEVLDVRLTDIEPLVRRLRRGGPLGAGARARSITLTSAAIDYVSARRATLGASARRLASAQASQEQASLDLAASESRLRDADLAEELAGLTAAVLVQLGGVSVLAQANRSGRQVLELLNALPPPRAVERASGGLEPPQAGPEAGSGPFGGRNGAFRGNVPARGPISTTMSQLSLIAPLTLLLAGPPAFESPLEAPLQDGPAAKASVAPDAGPDMEVRQGQVASLNGHIAGLSPLDFYVADGNGENENKLVRFHDQEGISAVGPMRRTNGQLMGWTGDLVRIEDRVYGIDVGARYVYVADLEGGLCLPVTPQLDQRWNGLQSLAYDAEGDNLYSVDLASGQLLEIHRGTGKIDTIPATDLQGRRGIRSLAFDQELQLLFAADHVDNLLFAVDPASGRLADMMALPAVENSIIEELTFFEGELYMMRGMRDEEGNTVGGQLQRVDLRSGYVENVGPLVEEVSPHALLINSVPEPFYWAQVGGPAVAELEFTTLLQTSARFPEPGRYEFALTVLTRSGPVSDRVVVNVTPAADE